MSPPASVVITVLMGIAIAVLRSFYVDVKRDFEHYRNAYYRSETECGKLRDEIRKFKRDKAIEDAERAHVVVRQNIEHRFKKY
jgi:hypothetical protein